MVDQLELISLPDDVGMLAGNDGQVGGEPKVTGGLAAYGNPGLGKLLDFPLQGALNVNELDDDDRRLFHNFGNHYNPWKA